MAIGDQVGKQTIDAILEEIPDLDARLQLLIKLLTYGIESILMEATTAIDTSGDKAIDGLHGILDRINGTTLTGTFSLTLHIPQKEIKK